MIKYCIKFLDYWHLGSGDSAGSMYDSIVVKDKFGLPYVPGKTIKGLVRQYFRVIEPNEEKIKHIFGSKADFEANSYFSNATLSEDEVAYLKKNHSLKKYLFAKISQTRIDENGVAKDQSLRQLEVVIPLTLSGFIKTDEKELIIKSLQSIKQMGLNRNRGLGRCEFLIVGDERWKDTIHASLKVILY